MPEALPVSLAYNPLSLDRHDQRRAQFLPTVSVLSGRVGLGLQAWRRWAAKQQRSVVQQSNPDVGILMGEWTAMLGRERDLTVDALNYLADQTHCPVSELQTRTANSTLYDLNGFWDSVPLDRRRDGVAAACYWLMERRVLCEVPLPNDLAAQLNQVLSGIDRHWLRVVKALAGLVPRERLPTLLFVPSPMDNALSRWIADAVRLLCELVIHVPTLCAALAVESTLFDDYLHTASESRYVALLREGLIPIVGISEQDLRDTVKRSTDNGSLGRTVQRLAEDGVSPQLAHSFAAAVHSLEDHSEATASDRARSAAEKFLYERLESLSQTAGLFVPNGELDFRFGPRNAEVDLLARGLRIAIELDGFFHFLGSDAYRRDRRKDWELQRRGFLVLRFLAEDVVARLEEILDTILSAVEMRQSRLQREEEQRHDDNRFDIPGGGVAVSTAVDARKKSARTGKDPGLPP
jgi:hypothetical protein